MTEKVLLNSGYKYYPEEHYKSCDKFYSKTISKEPAKVIRALYYDKFKDDGGLDYDFEYELYEEKENYAIKKHIYALNKDVPYTIEEIEGILLGEINEWKNLWSVPWWYAS